MAKGPSIPPPTPPEKTAEAELGAQQAAAGTNAANYTPNLFGPAGSQTYNKYDLPDVTLGNGKMVDGGQGISAVNNNFSPEFQSIFNRLTGSGSNLVDQLGVAANEGFRPDIDFGRLRQSYVDEGMADVRPEWDRQDTARNVMMSERGIPIGSQIWNDEENRVGEQRGDYTQSLTNQAHAAAAADEAQQFGQQLTEYQLPFSTFANGFYNPVAGMIAGLNGNPQQINTSPIQAPDMASIIANFDRANTNNAMIKAQSAGAGLDFAGKLAGAVISKLPFSDERLKEGIEPIGELHDGQDPLPIYEWSYKGDHERHIGPMAQDLAETNPELVYRDPSGFLRIDADAPTRPTLAALLRAGNMG